MTNPPPSETILAMRQGLTVGEVARVLSLREETVKTALRTGALASWQITPGKGWRYSTPEAVEAFAALRGLRVNWDALTEPAV